MTTIIMWAVDDFTAKKDTQEQFNRVSILTRI